MRPVRQMPATSMKPGKSDSQCRKINFSPLCQDIAACICNVLRSLQHQGLDTMGWTEDIVDIINWIPMLLFLFFPILLSGYWTGKNGCKLLLTCIVCSPRASLGLALVHMWNWRGLRESLPSGVPHCKGYAELQRFSSPEWSLLPARFMQGSKYWKGSWEEWGRGKVHGPHLPTAPNTGLCLDGTIWPQQYQVEYLDIDSCFMTRPLSFCNPDIIGLMPETKSTTPCITS